MGAPVRPAVKIIGVPKEPKEPVFEEISEGEFFWNEKELWIKTDEDSAVKIADGYHYNEWEGGEVCMPQKVEVKCVE